MTATTTIPLQAKEPMEPMEPMGTNGENQWGHSTLELIESHGNILCHSFADFVTAFAKYVTENAEVVCPHAVSAMRFCLIEKRLNPPS